MPAMGRENYPELRVVPKNQIHSPWRIGYNGWKKSILGVNDQITENNTSIMSAGVAFYAFLAIFPAIVALISIYGLAINPEQLQSQLEQLARMMPREAYEILEGRITNLMETSNNSLS